MNADLSAVKIRTYRSAEDFNFIVSSWLKSYRNSAPSIDVSNPVYFTFQTQLIESILRDPQTACLILHAADDNEQIMGYVVFNIAMPILHFVYVKQIFRKRKFGQLLVNIARARHEGKLMQCTHVAKKWKSKSKSYNLVYNPYIIKYFSNDQSPANDSGAGEPSLPVASMVQE